jgi:hypothetical protein
MHAEGFEYSEHRKALFYDGHECSDVVDYWQNVFLLQITTLAPWIVRYGIDQDGKMVEIAETPEQKAAQVENDRGYENPRGIAQG